MSGILHMPQGGTQVSMISQIPEVFMSGDITVQEMLDTLGQYTYVIKTDNTYATIQHLWTTEYVEGSQPWVISDTNGNGKMILINGYNQGGYNFHSGLNFQPQLTIQNTSTILIPVKAMFINRVLNFASNRAIAICQLAEAHWTSTTVKVHLIPYDKDKTVSDYISMLLAHMSGAENGVYSMQFTHNGIAAQNDIEGIMLGELPSSGKYLVGIETSSSQDNATPSIYKLQFRTY